MHVRDLIHPDDKSASNQYFSKLRNNGKYIGYRGRIFRKDKSIIWISVNSNPVFKDDQIICSIDTIRDFTLEIEKENERLRLFQELENAGRAKMDFLSMINH